MHQLGFLDFNIRLQRIDNAGDPLTKLNTAIDWEQFRPILEQARKKTRKSHEQKQNILFRFGAHTLCSVGTSPISQCLG